MLCAVMSLGAMRLGEAAALIRADHDAGCSPLGRLAVEATYNTKTRTVKETKTETPREMPMHPTLARLLAPGKHRDVNRDRTRRGSRRVPSCARRGDGRGRFASTEP